MWKVKTIVTGFALAIAGALAPMTIPQSEAADNDLFKQMDIGFFSVGGRATYYDPQEGQSRWFGGAQVRVNPFRYLSFEGSADYRQQDTEGTRVAHLPCASLCIDLSVGPHSLGPLSARRGRMVLHHGQRTGQFRRHAKSIWPPCRGRAPVLPQQPHLDRQHLSLHLAGGY